MKRVLILGNAGAGKSTFACDLGARVGLPVVHLDAHFWQPGWREMPRDQWARVVASLIAAPSWVMDGNYQSTLAARLAVADTVVVLELPRLQCIARVLWRGVRGRGRARSDLAPGCEEQFPDWAFLRWIWRFPREDLAPMRAQFEGVHGERQVVVLRGHASVARFLASVVVRAQPVGPGAGPSVT